MPSVFLKQQNDKKKYIILIHFDIKHFVYGKNANPIEKKMKTNESRIQVLEDYAICIAQNARYCNKTPFFYTNIINYCF